ncbi:MAG: hypothetical protein AB7N71_14775 [Phycisphaerae bacterium]
MFSQTQRSRFFARQWMVALSAYALFAAPLLIHTGCGTVNLDDILGNVNANSNGNGNNNGGSGLSTSSVGYFINNDFNSPILVGGRAQSRDEFFIYGTRNEDGSPASFDAIEVRTASGGRAFMTFDEGWPEYAEGPDGSFMRVTYITRSQFEIVANVTIFNAQTGASEALPVAFDGFQTAEQVAALIERETGINVDIPVAPTASPRFDKDDGRAISIKPGTLLFTAFVISIIGVINFTVGIGGQIFTQALEIATATIQQALLIIFSPILLIGTLVGGTIDRVEFTPLLEVFVRLPSQPQPRSN